MRRATHDDKTEAAVRDLQSKNKPSTPLGKSNSNNRRKNAPILTSSLFGVIITLFLVHSRIQTPTGNDISTPPPPPLPPSSSIASTEHYHFALPGIPHEIPDIQCHKPLHEYEFKSGAVRWITEHTVYSIEERGISMHCLLARAAERLGPDFCTKMCISLLDMDEHQPYSFMPASNADKMVNITPPLLFPDFTFESWPRSNDHSLPDVMAVVLKAAVDNGLPGTSRWHGRKSQLLWRGSPYGNQRLELINTSSLLLDIQSTVFNFTMDGKAMRMKMVSDNQVSRAQHCEYKFLLHLNGVFDNRYSSAIKWKLMCGSLVFAPAQPMFVEWWTHETLKPFKHYVPFTSTDDLIQQIQYYTQHPDEATEIAQRGMNLAIQAVEGVNDWIDATLKLYAKRTRHLNLCSNRNHSRPFKSLSDLRKEFGPSVCS